MQKTKFLPASSRGNTNIGWLNGYHSFSFASFYHEDRLPFGPLVIMNEDTIQPETGFGTHPHSIMEIITIVLEGFLRHRDNTGKEGTIQSGDVQVMSAGKGITHSEYNPDPHKKLRLLQIWISPDKKNVEPRYQQFFIGKEKPNEFYQLVAPYPGEGGAWIYQKTWIHLGNFDGNKSTSYSVKHVGNGIYLYLIAGSIRYADQLLGPGDALKIEDSETFNLDIVEQSKILLIEVPLDK